MEARTKTILMWTAIACLCFVGIPFHLKGEDREHLELAFSNYSRAFNKTYNGDSEADTRLLHFKVITYNLFLRIKFKNQSYRLNLP